MTAQTDQTRSPVREDRDPDAPYAKKAAREHGKPDQLRPDDRKAEDRQEALLDEGLEETFPASDPVAAKRIT
jgi:hypothetical protein